MANSKGTWNHQVFSTGLIVLLVAVVGSVVGAVCICMYFYQEARKKRLVRPVDLQPKVVEPFDTKKLWERDKPPVKLVNETSVNPSSGPPTPPPVAMAEVG